MSVSSAVEDLLAVIEQRKAERPAGSYVLQLLDAGPVRIGEKLIEEAREVAEAATAAEVDREHLVHEIADLWFHLLVMMGWSNLTIEDVAAELRRRRGISGLVEKASRQGGHR